MSGGEIGPHQHFAWNMKGITKRFAGVLALSNADLAVNSGEVLALVGQNGAGKSTLMKILAGVIQPDEGTIHMEGRRIILNDRRDSAQAGIGIVFQELSLFPHLSVMENIAIGNEPSAAELLIGVRCGKREWNAWEKIDLHIAPETIVATLPVSLQQMVEISRITYTDCKVLIFDEPTSALSEVEIEALFDIIRKLKAAGKAIIYISHKLAEVYQIADRIQVMRDGRNVGIWPVQELGMQDLVHHSRTSSGNGLYGIQRQTKQPHNPRGKQPILWQQTRWRFFQASSW